MTRPKSVVEQRLAERAQVEALAAAGLGKAEIAARLGISFFRVHGHVSSCQIPIAPVKSRWTRSESEELDAQILAERTRKSAPHRDPELARARKAIMQYPLTSLPGFKR